MKKKMERLDDELFRPLTFAEHKRIRGASGNVTTTTYVAKSGSGLSNIVTSASFPSTCTNQLTCNKPTSTTDERGNVTKWACEGGGPGALSRRGWKKGDVKLGDTLVVDGYLARDGSHTIDARRVTLPDGRVVSGASAGDGGPQVPGTTP